MRFLFHFVLLAGGLVLGTQAPAPTSRLEIAHGSSVTIDGTLSPGEWADARQFHIQAASDWPIRVLYKHDGANLLFAFEGVSRMQGGSEVFRFPEVLLDPTNAKTPTWTPGQWWLHASANDCEGNGEFNVYRKNGKFACSPEKPGWKANNHPYGNPPVVEIQIAFDKAGVAPNRSKAIGLAFSLTNTSDAWNFWPARAELAKPSTWGEAVLLP